MCLGKPFKYNSCVWHACVASLLLEICSFTSVTVLSHSSLASASSRPAGNSQPWVWNVFTFWTCYKLSAKANFAWLGRSLHLAQILFGSNVFQGFALWIWLSVADRGSPSQMWTQTKGKAPALCWCVLPAHMGLNVHMKIQCGLVFTQGHGSAYTQSNISSAGMNETFNLVDVFLSSLLNDQIYPRVVWPHLSLPYYALSPSLCISCT